MSCGVVRAAGHVGGDLPSTFCKGMRGKMGAAMRITLHSAHGTLDRVGGTARTFRTRLKGAKRPMARTILHEAQGVCVCV